MIESYLKLFGVFTTFFIIGVVQGEEAFRLVIYAFFTLVFVIWPIIIVIFLVKNNKKLASTSFKLKFNALINGIKVTSFSAICYYAIFSVRRFDIVLINLFLN